MIMNRRYLDRDDLFQIYMMLMVACKAFGINQGDKIYFTAFSIAMLFWGGSVFIHKWEKRIFLLFMILLSITTVSYLFGKNVTPVIFFMTIMGSINVDKKRVLNILCKEWILLFCINITLSFAGIKSMQMAYQYTETGMDGVAYGLGYGQKNQLAMACAIVICAFIYLKYDTMRLYELAAVDAIIAVILGYAKSSTGYIILLFVNFMVFLFKARFMSRFVKKMVLYMTPVVALFSILMSALYPYSDLMKELDRLLTTRVRLGYYALRKVPFSLFGTFVDKITLDNLYIAIYVRSGFIVYAAIVIVFWSTMKYLYSMNMKKEMIVWGGVILIGFCEGGVMNPYINIFALLIGCALETKFSKAKYKSKTMRNTNINFLHNKRVEQFIEIERERLDDGKK